MSVAQESTRVGDEQQGLADLDRFATAVGMPAHQAERLRSDLYMSLDDPAQARNAYLIASLVPGT